MPRGGAREGAGRKRGVPNKASSERQAAVQASGMTPLDYMLSVLRDDDNEPHNRLDAAKAAAPYVHQRLAAVEHTGKDGGPIQHEDVSDLEAARRVAFLLTQGVRHVKE